MLILVNIGRRGKRTEPLFWERALSESAEHTLKVVWKKSKINVMLRLTLTCAVVLGAILCPLGAGAFHSGGVAACDGCHSMHGTGVVSPGPWLTKAADPSSVCLNCHYGFGSSNSYSVASPDGSALTPGGDFYWLRKDFIWLNGVSPGQTHGHNIISIDYGFAQDTARPNAPGGTYQSGYLGCNSCHDPHGKVAGGSPTTSGSYGGSPQAGEAYGNYRLLGGAGYDGGSQAVGYRFAYDAPVAAENPLSKYGETDDSHVDYGDGMSEWCANCHADIHKGMHTGFRHVTDRAFGGSTMDRYNSYVRTGDFSGSQSTAYLQFVPFERGVNDPALLDPTSTMGPDSNSRIMCLTCHRAHASAFVYAGRWDLKALTIAESHPSAGDVGVVGNDILNAYYGRDIPTEFGSGQKAFCDKCHDIPRHGFPTGW